MTVKRVWGRRKDECYVCYGYKAAASLVEITIRNTSRIVCGECCEDMGVVPRKRSVAVYFIQGVEGGPVKIGKSRDTRKRLSALQVSSPDKLVLLGATVDYTEDQVHALFANHRIGGEWFDCSPPLVSFLRSIGFSPSTAQPSRVELIAA